MDTEKVKNAFDSFENDDFVAAKDELTNQIKSHMNDYFKEKLKLDGDVVDVPEPDDSVDGGSDQD